MVVIVQAFEGGEKDRCTVGVSTSIVVRNVQWQVVRRRGRLCNE